MTHCLDSWAVLEWLEGGEPAAARVDALFAAGTPIMSWINLGEVACVVARHHGEQEAATVVGRLQGALDLELPTRDRVLAAAALKAAHRISYADAFCVATALGHEAVLLTGDPEILGADADWPREDLRPG
ncbi:MAG: type II toxin-antitoxin system VapC family toxin [Acidimicrobiia bacterium]